MLKNQIIRKKIRMDEYAILDVQTGEIKDLNTPDISLVSSVITGKTIISSKNYVILDIDYLNKMISLNKGKINQLKLDLGLLLLICSSMEYNTNHLESSENNPQSAKSIASELGISQRTVKDSLNRLIQIDLLFYGSINGKNEPKKYYVNPLFLRKGKLFLKELFQAFK
jgi:hypothetical protein